MTFSVVSYIGLFCSVAKYLGPIFLKCDCCRYWAYVVMLSAINSPNMFPVIKYLIDNRYQPALEAFAIMRKRHMSQNDDWQRKEK